MNAGKDEIRSSNGQESTSQDSMHLVFTISETRKIEHVKYCLDHVMWKCYVLVCTRAVQEFKASPANLSKIYPVCSISIQFNSEH